MNIFEGLASAGMGVVTDPRQMIAVPQDQLEAMQRANMWAMRQANDPSVATLLRCINALNQGGEPERPLDERFANFKVRLAEALKKHGMD